LLLNPDSGLAVITMSNLVNESGLANGIAAQIFGKFSDSGLHSTAVPSSGVYRVARTIQYGPHAL